MIHKLKAIYLDLWISKKILTKGQRSKFISFIGLSSILGISIGVMALIVVMSVMNGFHYELKKRILDATAHIEIIGDIDDQEKAEIITNQISDLKNVYGLAPYISGEALLSKGKNNLGVIVRGVDENKERNVNNLFNKITIGSNHLLNDKYEMIIGLDLARNLSVTVGDSVTLLIPQLTFTPVGNFPVMKKFVISGIFDAGVYEYDNGLVLINDNNARKIFFKNKISFYSGFKVQLNDPEKTVDTELKIKEILLNANLYPYVTNWTKKNQNFFSAIQMEKKVMAIILTLIIAVAAFNLIASLTMSVNERKKDIAILKTIGFSKLQITRIFIFQGFLVGLIGSLFGLLLGIIISININTIVPFIENLFNTHFLSKDVYYIDELPSLILISDLYFVVGISIVLSLLATLYPSYMAASYNPAEILKNE